MKTFHLSILASSSLPLPQRLDASGNGSGDIQVQGSQVTLTDGSEIEASTLGTGQGGNLVVNAQDSVQVIGISKGTGVAGDINLKVLNNVTLQGQGSGVFANTAAGSTGSGGSIVIDPTNLTIANGAQVAVNSLGQGEAGNIFLQAGAITLDHGFVSATAASVNGGNISLQVPESLLLRHGSLISATAGTAKGGGNGGNISIDNTVLVIAFPTEASDISANAFRGNGGSVKINASGIFGFQSQPTDTSRSDITASSTGGGINGVVNLNTLDVDLSHALVALPVILADTSKQIASGCAAGNGTTESRFVVTGRGGLPSNPSEPLSSDAVWSDTRFVAVTGKQHSQNVSAPQPSTSAEVAFVPATGWVFNGKGDVTLTAAVPSERIQVPWLTPASCQTR